MCPKDFQRQHKVWEYRNLRYFQSKHHDTSLIEIARQIRKLQIVEGLKTARPAAILNIHFTEFFSLKTPDKSIDIKENSVLIFRKNIISVYKKPKTTNKYTKISIV